MKLGRFIELLFGWGPDRQPNDDYYLRYWGIACRGVFLGIVTAFEVKR